MNPLLKDIFAEAQRLVTLAADHNLKIGTAESCTGGLIGAAITAIPGSSQVFMGGIIAYDNHVKMNVLGVPKTVLRQHGAVSHDVAAHMAEGALKVLNLDVAISVTGIAGPGGSTAEKPIGTVWMGIAKRNVENRITSEAKLYEFGDIGRNKVRDHTCLEAIKTLSLSIETKINRQYETKH